MYKTKIIDVRSVLYKSFLFIGIAIALLLGTLFTIKNAYAAITTQLELGSRGADVTELQTYLAADASIYPSGLITGYFGPLTQAAVQRFQAAQGIVNSGTPATTGYGRVGPMTMARINALMGSGSTQIYWDTVPVLSPVNVQSSRTSATVTWSSNEATQGQVYYDTVPLRADEATGPHQVPYVSGTLAIDVVGMQTAHSVTIQNLAPNTQYYYLVRTIDSAGNITMTWPTTFRTSP